MACMNVYVRELSRLLGQQGIAVDVYTRRQDPWEPTVVPLGRGYGSFTCMPPPAAP
jgi:D-inositol-3-phosphate glycosyltransferase